MTGPGTGAWTDVWGRVLGSGASNRRQVLVLDLVQRKRLGRTRIRTSTYKDRRGTKTETCTGKRTGISAGPGVGNGTEHTTGNRTTAKL
jgi:hypothetical protein